MTSNSTIEFSPANTHVALLYGGTSKEREISLMSGEGVYAALQEAGFPVTLLDTAEPTFLHDLIECQADVAFISLHGHGGEDGSIQAILQFLNLPYTGSGISASAIAMDKGKSKIFYREAGLITAPSVVFNSRDIKSTSDLEKVVDQIGIPCVLKPSDDGSALGITIVTEKNQVEDAFQSAIGVSDEIMVEKYLTGVEVTCAVLGNDDPIVLPVIEIVPAKGFYDFHAKYTPGASDHIIPARISEKALKAVEDASLVAHKALGCRGVSRTDFIVDENDVPWILETNTIPGMTSTSLLPDAAQHAGISYVELVTRMVQDALEDGPYKR